MGAPKDDGEGNSGILDALEKMKISLRREFDDKLHDCRSSLQAKANLLENDLNKRIDDLEKANAKLDERMKKTVDENSLLAADNLDKIEAL